MTEYKLSRKCISCSANKMILLATTDGKHKPLLYVNIVQDIYSWNDMKAWLRRNRHYIVVTSKGNKITIPDFIVLMDTINDEKAQQNPDYVFIDNDGFGFRR